ncbi:MAG: hypothetical protein ACRD17_05675, partial [Terriglobales bacterium]
EYMVAGAVALAHHGLPRYTGDLDVWIRSSPENARRTLAALKDIGFGAGERQGRLAPARPNPWWPGLLA